MKKTLALASVAALAGLTACSVTAPASGESGQPEPGRPEHGPEANADGAASASPAAGTREACRRFNSLFADYAAVSSDDPQGYEDVYVKAEEAKDTVTGDLQGLFASLSLLAIDHSAAAESGGEPAQESKDALRDAVFANSGTCTSEGVTLRF